MSSPASDAGPGSRGQLVRAALWLAGAGALTFMVASARSAPWYAWAAAIAVDLVALIVAANAAMGAMIRKWTRT